MILAKKENREDSGPVEPPKLLLKPKPNTESQKQAVTQPAAISIAVREPPGNAPAKTATVTQPGTGGFPASAAGVSNARDLSDVRPEAKPAPIESNQSKYKQMTSPLPLINDHFQIDSSPLNFLSESNDSFHVVGVVGAQGTGKSTLLNLLAVDLPYSFKGWSSEHDRFATNRTSENGSCNPTSEGVNMFVTAERVILLDSSPVLCNPYKKDAVLSELDDLKIISFMLSVCHTVLVVEEEPFNTSLLRLLCCADMMRLSSLAGDKSEKLANPTANSVIHRPHVMFVHNLAKPSMFLPVFRQRLDQTYRACLKNTELRILAGNDLPDRTNARHSEQPLNTFTFPKVPKSMQFVFAHIIS